jgi:hypothetical protein
LSGSHGEEGIQEILLDKFVRKVTFMRSGVWCRLSGSGIAATFISSSGE